MPSSGYWGIVPAAGVGRRMGGENPKQYLELLEGKSILQSTLEIFINHPRIRGVVVVLSENDDCWSALGLQHPKLHTAIGGEERFHSVLNGLHYLAELTESDDWVLVHDAARPCLSHSDLDLLINTLGAHPVGGLLGFPVSDTLKRVDANNQVITTVDRRQLWRAYTPQMFPLQTLTQALEEGIAKGLALTDEASAIEALGLQPQMVQGCPDNIKITHPEDLDQARLTLTLRKNNMNHRPKIAVGQGYDVHRLVEDRPLIIGGVNIEHHLGLDAHSDGDVLIHALCDALLGAVGEGDIGRHFPDSDVRFKGIDSRELLRDVVGLLKKKGVTLANADITIVAQAPKMAPYLEQMRHFLSLDMESLPEQINIKATTTERLGFSGREEGIAVYAMVLVSSS